MYHLHTFSCTYFYSHPREGGDIEDSNFVERQYISIHAPAKGATIITDEKYHNVTDFYSRPREGGDILSVLIRQVLLHFYSRPREGGDILSVLIRQVLLHFYSRPREGGDVSHYCISIFHTISIHAPAKGATLPLMDRISVPIFLFTPPRRGRPFWQFHPRIHDQFLFTPPRRGRLLSFGVPLSPILFLFTPPRRGRQHTFIIFISICVQLLSIMHNAISLLFIFRT